MTNLEFQRQRPAQIFVEDLEHRVLVYMWWKDAAIAARHAVTLGGRPVSQAAFSVPIVEVAVFCDVPDATEQRQIVFAGAVFAVEKSELLVRQFLIGGHHVFGQFEQRILVTPEKLTNRDLHEWTNFQDVHDRGHGQSEETRGVLRLAGR